MKYSLSSASFQLFFFIIILFKGRKKRCFRVVLRLAVMFLCSHAGLLIPPRDKLLKTLTPLQAPRTLSIYRERIDFFFWALLLVATHPNPKLYSDVIYGGCVSRCLMLSGFFFFFPVCTARGSLFGHELRIFHALRESFVAGGGDQNVLMRNKMPG